jgi:hypothetical protein
MNDLQLHLLLIFFVEAIYFLSRVVVVIPYNNFKSARKILSDKSLEKGIHVVHPFVGANYNRYIVALQVAALS